VEEEGVTVKVEEPGLPMEAGLKLVVTPVGNPLMLRAMLLPLRAFTVATEIV
jgi:hypothetical protein